MGVDDGRRHLLHREPRKLRTKLWCSNSTCSAAKCREGTSALPGPVGPEIWC